MASNRPKKKKRVLRKKNAPKRSRFRGLFIHLIVFLFLALSTVFLFLLPTPPVKNVERPVFENFSRVPKTPIEKKEEKERPKPQKRLPLVAILIDDMGYDYCLCKKFILLGAPLSFAFLPYGPNTARLARLALSKKRDVLAHIPMEPVNKSVDPGPGVLTVDMDLDSLVETLSEDLKAVPGAIGINNHMGSKFTANKEAMERLLPFLKQRGLFFIDSRTSKETVAYETARQIGVPCGQRAVFLDHVNSRKAVKDELKRLVRLAEKNGSAIAIGHPYQNTYQVLYDMLPLMRRHVKLVPVHKLVR